MIYFVQRPDTLAIKIGTTVRLAERFAALAKEAGQELAFLGIVDGSFREEKEYHRRFAHLRLEGEWFTPGSDLMDFIGANARQWNEEDDVTKVSIIGLCGTEAFAEWLDGLVDHTHLGSRALLAKHALREFAIRHGYEEPQPKR